MNTMRTRHRSAPSVVVTGLGVVSSIGVGKKRFLEGLLSGTNGIAKISQFDASRLSSQIAGEVRDFVFDGYTSRKRARQLDRGSRFGFVAVKEAIGDSGLRIPFANPHRIAVVVGTAIGGGVVKGLRYHDRIRERGPERASPFFMIFSIDACAGYLAVEFGVRGPNLTVSSGCSSSASALSIAFDLLRVKAVDVAVVCGVEAPLDETIMAMFCASGILSTRNDKPQLACRPFDLDRDGIVLAEGAGAMILESEDHALERGARVYAKFASYGTTCDPFSMGRVAPSPSEMVICMREALSRSGNNPSEVDYINAYANGSRHTDVLEAQAIREVLGGHLPQAAVSSTKSLLGHPLGASAILETIATVLGISRGFVPPSANCENLDPECGFLGVMRSAREQRIHVALKNSFSLGNRNTSLVFQEYQYP
jgi:3-oxoacyl-[acyl-carrier-protein] synthase II